MINFTPALFIFGFFILSLFYFWLLKTQETDRLLKSLTATIVVVFLFSMILFLNFDYAVKNTKIVNTIDFQNIKEVDIVSIDFGYNILKNDNQGNFLIKTLDGKDLLVSKSLLKCEESLKDYLNKDQSGKITFQVLEKEPSISWLKFIKINTVVLEGKAILSK